MLLKRKRRKEFQAGLAVEQREEEMRDMCRSLPYLFSFSCSGLRADVVILHTQLWGDSKVFVSV